MCFHHGLRYFQYLYKLRIIFLGIGKCVCVIPVRNSFAKNHVVFHLVFNEKRFCYCWWSNVDIQFNRTTLLNCTSNICACAWEKITNLCMFPNYLLSRVRIGWSCNSIFIITTHAPWTKWNFGNTIHILSIYIVPCRLKIYQLSLNN